MYGAYNVTVTRAGTAGGLKMVSVEMQRAGDLNDNSGIGGSPRSWAIVEVERTTLNKLEFGFQSSKKEDKRRRENSPQTRPLGLRAFHIRLVES
jgi:hypothetical protein